MGAISTGRNVALRHQVARGWFLQSFAVWRPLLSLAGMARSYRWSASR